jgi:hypothetical protein
MTSIPLNIVGGTNIGRYPKISSESTYNMIVSDNALVPFSGYKSVLSITDSGQSRQVYVSSLSNRMYYVLDDGLYSIEKDLSFSKLGTIDTNSGTVGISENANSEIAIIDDLNLYVYNYDTGSLVKHSESDLGFRPTSIDEQDGYLIVSCDGSNQFRISDPNNASSFPEEQAGEIGADKIVAVKVLDRQLFVFGEKHTEVWRDSGLQVMPYQKDQSMGISYGCLQKDTIASGFGFIVWLAASEDADAVIVVSDGGIPKELPVSDGVDYKISQLQKPEDSSAFLFQEDGHIFYQITFYSDNLTLVFDFKTKQFIYATDENLNYHIAKKAVHFKSKYYFIAFNNNPSMYELSSDIDNYDNKVIPRIRILKTYRTQDHEYFKVNKLEVVASTGYSKDPLRVQLSVSKDGGVTFGNYITKTTGDQAKRNHLMKWWQLGYAYEWTFQFRFYGKGRFTIISASADVGAVGAVGGMAA